jgi:hypothetical protein
MHSIPYFPIPPYHGKVTHVVVGSGEVPETAGSPYSPPKVFVMEMFPWNLFYGSLFEASQGNKERYARQPVLKREHP